MTIDLEFSFFFSITVYKNIDRNQNMMEKSFKSNYDFFKCILKIMYVIKKKKL